MEIKLSHSNFANYVEKFNDKTFSWNPRYLIINNSKFFFYDLKPSKKQKFFIP